MVQCYPRWCEIMDKAGTLGWVNWAKKNPNRAKRKHPHIAQLLDGVPNLGNISTPTHWSYELDEPFLTFYLWWQISLTPSGRFLGCHWESGGDGGEGVILHTV